MDSGSKLEVSPLRNDFYILNKVESLDRVVLGHVLRVPQVLSVLWHANRKRMTKSSGLPTAPRSRGIDEIRLS
jgi:hypothetical protein